MCTTLYYVAFVKDDKDESFTGDTYFSFRFPTTDELKLVLEILQNNPDLIPKFDKDMSALFVKLVGKNTDTIKKLDEALTEEEYAIALPKGSDLTDTVNATIKELNESGKMDEIVSKYISAE